MMVDLFSELFELCRNGCIPTVKFTEAMKELHQKKAITSTEDGQLEQWFDDVSAAVFISINFNETLKSLIRL
jgi:hypothetical protein